MQTNSPKRACPILKYGTKNVTGIRGDKDDIVGNLIIPRRLTGIAYRVFADCTNLTSVTFPNQFIRIEREAFKNCCNLSTLVMPETLTFIGMSAFENFLESMF